MTMVTDPPQETKGGRKKKLRFFQVHFLIEGNVYAITPQPIDPSLGRKAFKVRRLDGKEGPTTYDVRFTADHRGICDCKGFLRWGHCKHIETIEAAGKVFDLE